MKKSKLCIAIAASLFAVNAAATDVKQELSLLKQQMRIINERILELESIVNDEKQNVDTQQSVTESVMVKQEAPKVKSSRLTKSDKNKDIKLYASLRPTLGYHDENDEKSWDVRDALSNAGFKSTYQFMQGWSTTLHGEWSIDLSNNADFGKARQVYVAVDTPYGKVGLGKQRPVQYLFIAEHNDIFDHSNSPYAYDLESPFFVNNMITYQLNQGDFTWMLASQVNGADGNNQSDLFNAGVSYDIDNLHLGLTYLKQAAFDDDTRLGDDKVYAGSIAYTFDNDLYLALAYQDKEYERQTLLERDGYTFDLALAYPLSAHYKLKAGYFDFEDGNIDLLTNDHDGGNITLEWLPSDDVKFHIEYLYRNFEQQSDFSSISVGVRYDFAQSWTF